MAAFFAGAMNSVAGGGSFLSFPALIFAGVPAISANATNNAAMWVGTLGSARGYREEVREHRSLLLPVLLASAVGSLIGASLLLLTPQALFVRLIPWLLLFATLLFALSPLLARRSGARTASRSVADRRAVCRRGVWRLFRRGHGNLDARRTRVFRPP